MFILVFVLYAMCIYLFLKCISWFWNDLMDHIHRHDDNDY